MNFTAGIALALAVFSGGSTPTAQAQGLAQPMPQALSVQEYVKTYFADEPVMYAIAGCESNYRQYDTDGSILRNTHSSALGLFQIMQSTHEKTAAQLGIDIYTIQGNAAYAKYLYDQEGTAPWNSSKACWGKLAVK
jgi:6-phosphogluconolactonase/glucosamine-6-phosphate isomerase/deaminase